MKEIKRPIIHDGHIMQIILPLIGLNVFFIDELLLLQKFMLQILIIMIAYVYSSLVTFYEKTKVEEESVLTFNYIKNMEV